MRKVRTVFVGLLVAVVVYSGVCRSALALTPGDANGDGVVDVSDLQCAVLASLAPESPPCLLDIGAVDINCDDDVDVADIQLLVGLVLVFPAPGLPVGVDFNGNGVHDACEGAFCGNAAVEEDETCDDGNQVWGDGCTPLCEDETGMNLVLIEGTVSYSGNVGLSDVLVIMVSNVPIEDLYDYPEDTVAAALINPGPQFPFFYQAPVQAGTYWVSAILNKGGTEGLGPEDPATSYPFALEVDADNWAMGVDMDLLGSSGTGQISGTISIENGQATPNDRLHIVLSTTPPPEVNVSKSISVKPVSFPYTYVFENIGFGTFYVAAQFDVGDNNEDQPGDEDYLGVYQSFMNPKPIALAPGEVVDGIDFTVYLDPF